MTNVSCNGKHVIEIIIEVMQVTERALLVHLKQTSVKHCLDTGVRYHMSKTYILF